MLNELKMAKHHFSHFNNYMKVKFSVESKAFNCLYRYITFPNLDSNYFILEPISS